MATIELYSVPWLPATNATTGPSRRPLMTATGIESAESDPAGTAITPVTTVPGCAVAVPTVKGPTLRPWAMATPGRQSAIVIARRIDVSMDAGLRGIED